MYVQDGGKTTGLVWPVTARQVLVLPDQARWKFDCLAHCWE